MASIELLERLRRGYRPSIDVVEHQAPTELVAAEDITLIAGVPTRGEKSARAGLRGMRRLVIAWPPVSPSARLCSRHERPRGGGLHGPEARAPVGRGAAGQP
jgi:hypothetical protein